MHFERDGARLFYTTLGNGPDVVLLHPTPTHHAFWLPVVRILANSYRFILIDLRGHGQSDATVEISEPFTMQKLAQDVHAILQELAIDRAAFVGCSIGSYLLYEYWRTFPQEMAAMVLTCGKPQSDTVVNREKREEWMAMARQPGGLERFLDQMADTLIGPTARRVNPSVRDEARKMMAAMSLDAMIAVQRGLVLRPDSVPMLSTISIPVCAVAGEEDQSSTPSEMRVVADLAPNAEFHLLEKAGHYAPLEQPDKFAAIISKFLRAHYSPQTAQDRIAD